MATAGRFSANPLPILLVDDFAPFRTTIRQILDRCRDFTVVGEAEDGAAAIELARALAPQVVIMDVNMPRVDGVEATRHIKKMLPEAHVIAVTLNDDPYTHEAMKAAGSSAFLSKSCTDQLPRLIATVTGRSLSNEELW